MRPIRRGRFGKPLAVGQDGRDGIVVDELLRGVWRGADARGAKGQEAVSLEDEVGVDVDASDGSCIEVESWEF